MDYITKTNQFVRSNGFSEYYTDMDYAYGSIHIKIREISTETYVEFYIKFGWNTFNN